MPIALDDEGDIRTKIEAKNGKIVVVRSQDVSRYLNANQREFNDAPSWRPYASGRKERGLRKLAEIPNLVVEQWLKEGVNVFSPDPEMQKKVRRKLDDYTNRKLRTMPGKMGTRTRHF
jgi:hypothetical protein